MDTEQKQLTAEDIDAMVAGPEMDALIAERVMGWRWLPYIEDIVLLWPPDGFPGAILPSSPIDGLTQLSDGHYLPWQMEEFSTDIAAAWQVVEHMITLKWCLARFTNAGNRYSAWFARNIREGEPRIHGYGGTSAPLAICRAALKATLTR